MCSLGTAMVTVSVGSTAKEQFSVLPSSAVSNDELPVNVRLELKQIELLLSVTMRVTPLTVSDGRVTGDPSCILILSLNRSLLQARAATSLVQV